MPPSRGSSIGTPFIPWTLLLTRFLQAVAQQHVLGLPRRPTLGQQFGQAFQARVHRLSAFRGRRPDRGQLGHQLG
ncbi:hypothetical protein ACYOEI_23560, partial [Singulisphaera rosea]